MNEHTQSTGSEASYISYLLRLWRGDDGENGSRPGPTLWRGSLENPHTGQRLGFASLEALFQHLREETGAGSASPQRSLASKGSRRPKMWMVTLGIFVVTLSMTGCMSVAADGGIAVAMSPVSISSNPGQAAGVQVTLLSPYSMISLDDGDPDRVKFDLPLLYLHQGRAVTPAAERTLNLSIAGLPGGSVVQVDIVSLHENISTGRNHTASRRFTLPTFT